ncbi:MAG: CDP-diacylglycerol--serine O-phosphatidyltransferase [Deltaproteobacteria bacterium]|nr:CDP-diacylglycerol--serine O-phosphatidyltransferase [Deltaproteobacteria bacterium]
MREFGRVKSGVFLLPSLCTTGNLFCGFYAIVKALHSDFIAAAWAILGAGLFDFLDGRVARLARAESRFGIEYDSLVDLASFGLAPGILFYLWSLSGFHRIGWLAAFLFFACAALRLARFNVQITTVERAYFQGLPVPVAAYLMAATVISYHDWFGPAAPGRNWAVLWATIGLALLMVSTIRYRSFKQIDLRGRWSFFTLVIAVGLLAVIAAAPPMSLFVLICCYVAWGVIEELVTMRKGRQVWCDLRARRTARRIRRLEQVLQQKIRPINPGGGK